MNDTPNLALPYILAAQAQKHVTHNEAIRALDCLVQLAVESRALTAPPPEPADGSRFIVGASATGEWDGQSGKIAAFQDGAWAFYEPKTGWTAWVTDEHALLIYDAGTWTPFSGGDGEGSGGDGGGLEAPIANSDLANMASGAIKGRASAGSGHPEDLTGTQATALLDAFVASGPSHKKGLVPDPGAAAGTTKFLREDGSWAEPTSAGGGDSGDITELDSLEHIGINATGDTTNRLSVKSPATLFDNVGNGHQQKINKYTSGDTASVLYQTNYSGRAEIGLTGDDDFHFKVSPDGTTWHDAIIIDKDTGEVSFPSNPPVEGGDTDVSELALSLTLLALQVADSTNVVLFLGDKKNRIFDSFDALTYVNTGGATNLDTSAAGILKPTASMTTEGGAPTTTLTPSTVLFSKVNPLTNSQTILSIGYYAANAQTGVIKIAQRQSATSYDIVYSQAVSHPGGGMVNFALTTPYTVPASGTFYPGLWTNNNNINVSAMARFSITASGDQPVGTGYVGTESPSANSPTMQATYSVNNLTVTSATFTAATAPTAMKGLIRVKEVDAATANTDYTLEFSRDSGTSWTAATLTELFTSPSPDASVRVVQSNDVDVSGQPLGTGPMWRFKTLNNRNVQLCDAALYWGP